jgi:hypothetical protein
MSAATARTFVTVLLALICAGCATDRPGMRPADARPLSAVEIRNLIDRAVAESRVFDDDNSGGLTFAFRSDGQLSMHSRFFAVRSIGGSWRIDDNSASLCTRIESDPETCARVHRLATASERYYVEIAGGTQKANTFTLR